MPSWDRPRGGGDKPPTPRVPGYDPYVPVNPASDRHNRHEQAEGAAQDNSTQPRDKPAERGARGREGTAATGDGADKNADRRGYKAMFERQDKLLESQEQRIGRLASDLGKRDAEIGRLESENDRQAGTIERLESEIEGLKAENQKDRGEIRGEDRGSDPGGDNGPDRPNDRRSPDGTHDGGEQGNTVDKHTERLERTVQRQDRTIDRQERTIERQDAKIGKLEDDSDRPRARIAELERADSTTSSAITEKESGDADQEVQKKTRPWDRIHMPGDRAAKVVAEAGGTAEAIALGTHAITTTEGAISAAAAAFGWALASWGKEKWDKWQERKHNADQPEG